MFCRVYFCVFVFTKNTKVNSAEHPFFFSQHKKIFNFFFVVLFAVCHAELNAVLQKNASDVRGCRMYVALYPCHECAKILVQVHNVFFSISQYGVQILCL